MINVKPISVNDCWQGRRYATKYFKQWQKTVIEEMWLNAKLFKQESIKWERIILKVKIYLKYPLKSDTDNYLKPIIDCIVKSGLIKDDRYIFQIIAEKMKSEKEGFDFDMMEY